MQTLATARWRPWATGLALGLGAALYVLQVERHAPVGEWLIWRYASAVALAGWLALACLAGGYPLSRWLRGGRLPLEEQLATSFATGVVVYFLGMFVAGLLHLYGPAWFVLWPTALIAGGGPMLWRDARRAARHLRRARRRRQGPPWLAAVLVFGGLAFGYLWMLTLVPGNIGFDPRWKHLAIAEQYVALGGVEPFREGWVPGTHPHLSSFLYAWAFMVPGAGTFHRLVLALQVEFVVFAGATLAIGPLVRRLVPEARARHVWAARFLFPGVFLYDSNLNGGADHIAAAFVVPLYLVLLRAWPDLHPKRLAHLVILMAGAALTKYSAGIAVLGPVVLAVAARACWLALGQRRRGGPRYWLWGPLTAVAVGLAITAPHWLKNLAWHGDPLYPQLHHIFPASPRLAENARVYDWGYLQQKWGAPEGWEGVKASLKVLWTFSFDPHDWPMFHGKVPVFGSLFTLSMLALPFVAAGRRVWGLAAFVHLSVLFWYQVHHQDRHLQTIVPLMAAVLAAVMLKAWRQGPAPRLGLLALLTVQLGFSGDVPFLPGHALLGKESPIPAAQALFSRLHRKAPKQTQLRTFIDLDRLRRHLPKDAVVLMHQVHLTTGLRRVRVSDFKGWQMGIDYGATPDAAAIWDTLHRLGITHMVWPTGRSRGWDTVAGDLAFRRFVRTYAKGKTRIGPYTVAPLPARRPAARSLAGPVLFLGCGQKYATGLYPFAAMRKTPFHEPGARARYPAPQRPLKDVTRAGPLLRQADYVVVQSGRDCPKLALPRSLRAGFVRVAQRRRRENLKTANASSRVIFDLWVRKAPRPEGRRAPARPAPSPPR